MPQTISSDVPYAMLADIGGTNARFALLDAAGSIQHARMLAVQDFDSLEAAIRTYWRDILTSASSGTPIHAAIAIANPVDGDWVQMTNHHWSFSIEAMRVALRLETLLVVNDFTALAMALPRLNAADLLQVGTGRARLRAMVGLVGPGTGLGVSGLLPMDERWVALGSEGGHVSFAPTDALEQRIHAAAKAHYGHVSAERLLSGPGLQYIHSVLTGVNVTSAQALQPAEITTFAQVGGDPTARQAIDVFLGMLGSFTGNVALTYGALGGMYIGGGIVPRLAWRIADSPFRQRFEDKGRFARYLGDIPTYVITAENPTLSGVRAILEQALSQPRTADITHEIRVRHARLPKAFRQVADVLLVAPEQFVNSATSAIAARAGVSDPTIVRFCRAFGYDGVPDFKRALATTLSGTMPIRHSTVTRGDSPQQLAVKVLDNTVAAIMQLRAELSREALLLAAQRLADVRRLRLFGVGHSGVTCRDAETRFVRLGYDAQAITDAALMPPYGSLLQAGDGVIVISNSGNISELTSLADAARRVGACVIGITPSRSALAASCDVVLAVEHDENDGEHVSMISRILQLLMIDIITVSRENAATRLPLAALGDTDALTRDVTHTNSARDDRAHTPGNSLDGDAALAPVAPIAPTRRARISHLS